MIPHSTREFVDLLKSENEILEISDVVDPHLELAEIQRQVVAQNGPALLFSNVKGSRFSVASNLYGSAKRIDLAFGKFPEKFVHEAADTLQNFFPPTFGKLWQSRHLAKNALKMGTRRTDATVVTENRLQSLLELPQLQCWPEDGGAFITLPLVYTQSPSSGKSNLGMYRIQLFNETQCGMHIQIHRGGGFHYHEAEQQNQALPVHIYVGGPPALTLAAILPLPEDIPEILFASLLQQKKIQTSQKPELSSLPFLNEADFCIVGQIPPHERQPEGPFGDHFGYYSLKHEYPFVNVQHIFHRNNAIYPATVVGRPPQEDHYLACYLQDLLKPLIHLVMPQVRDVWAYEESGVHSLAGAVVKDRYPREALTTSLRILGEGQLSLTKVLMVTDAGVDLKDFKSFLPAVLERMDLRTDLFILSNISQDTLDYTAKKIHDGSKAIFLGVGEVKRQLPQIFSGTLQNSAFKSPRVFCRGVLAVEGPAYATTPDLKEKLAAEDALQDWPLVVLVDDATAATQTAADFLWHVFTRFEPAADITARNQTLNRFHVEFTAPIVIDCRLKPWYAPTLESDPAIVKKVKPLLQKHGFET